VLRAGQREGNLQPALAICAETHQVPVSRINGKVVELTAVARHCPMRTYRTSRPASPSCLEPALPTQTTLQRSGLGVSSSRISSTTWPRLSSKLPRRRKPSFEESSTRQGSLFGLRSRLMTRLARLLDATRFDRRALVRAELGVLSSTGSTSSDDTPGLVSFEMRNHEPLVSRGAQGLDS